MKLSRSRLIAWVAAGAIAAIGWGSLGFVVEGVTGMLVAAFISATLVAGVASLATD